MNTPIVTTELDPAEQRRRTLAKSKATRLARSLGFRQVAGRPGWWFHPDIDPAHVFLLSGPQPVEDAGTLITQVFYDGIQAGMQHARKKMREAVGL